MLPAEASPACSGSSQRQTLDAARAHFTPAVAPSALLVQQARCVLQAAPASVPPLYARVDGIVDGDTLILMELELIEPTLYLDTDAQAADRLADALEKAVLMET